MQLMRAGGRGLRSVCQGPGPGRTTRGFEVNFGGNGVLHFRRGMGVLLRWLVFIKSRQLFYFKSCSAFALTSFYEY
jgi:hypothetical protein